MATQNQNVSKTQQQNTMNRGKVLSFWTVIKNKKMEIHMMNNTIVNGIFLGTKSDPSQLLIKSLQTPIGMYPFTLLRQSDISYIKIL